MGWVKSSYSWANGNCVEVNWRKASACQTGECVEVATVPAVLVRDTKDNGNGPVLAFTQEEWRAFLSRCGRG